MNPMFVFNAIELDYYAKSFEDVVSTFELFTSFDKAYEFLTYEIEKLSTKSGKWSLIYEDINEDEQFIIMEFENVDESHPGAFNKICFSIEKIYPKQ